MTVLFADIVGSTPLFAELSPSEAVEWLNDIYSGFDEVVARHGADKIAPSATTIWSPPVCRNVVATTQRSPPAWRLKCSKC